ncbi:hypothetical protein ABZ299_30125 [Streptomyces sp. NPDC006184]|uniref:hypothetical protein n=1 Tax=Streptomyces sp. NPDC006184 TaxID=3155455 RepID=UPI0033ABC63C
MHVLVPDDPVMAVNFLSVEEPLLHSLHYYYRAELTDAQAAIIRVAYDSWGELQQELPARFRSHAPDAVTDEEDGYVLEGVAGQRLTRLCAIDAGQRVHHLEACYRMLRQAQLDRHHGALALLADVLLEINSGIDFVDRLRRVLQVLRLPSPPRILAAIPPPAHRESVTVVALNTEEEREYRGHCGKVIGILSGDDGFAFVTHWALYAM